MNQADSQGELDASQRITQQIAELDDWRGRMLASLRQVILDSSPDLKEEWKWGTGVWTYKGMVCSVGVFKDHVKLNFFKGASLEDPKKLFNAGLEAKATRGIDFYEGDEVDEEGVKALIQAAAAYNLK